MKLWPYLHFKGTAEQALNFYKDILGGTIPVLQRYGDTPKEYQNDPSMNNRIMHATLRRWDNEIMFADVNRPDFVFGNNVYLSINCTSEEEIDNLYAKLSVSAKEISVALQDTFRGAKFAGFIDQFGVGRYLNRDKPKT